MDIINSLLINYTSKNNRNDYLNIFKLPIEYLEESEKKTISENIINDLELLKLKNNNIELNDISNNFNQDISNIISLYSYVFKPKDIFEKSILERWSKYYSNNQDFLLNSQELLKNFKPTVSYVYNLNNDICNNNYSYEENLYYSCEEIFYDDGFIEKYQYIDIPYLNKYNDDETCMQVLSIYNISSPILSLVIPILFLLLPFLIIKLQGHEITIEKYLEYLKAIFNKHIIGQFFTNFYDANLSTKIYLLFSFGFYLFQIYLNIVTCKKYYKNIKFIHNKLFLLRDYLKDSLNKFNNLLKYTNNLKKYSTFNDNIVKNNKILNNYLTELNKINNYEISITKILELGQLMKCFYKLNNDTCIINSLYYSFGLNGYIKNIILLQSQIKKNNINYCIFDNTCNTSINNSYFVSLIDNEKIIKNSCNLNKNIILTGPNASGKTTFLKSILFNILVSQQIGCGFYSHAKIKIYDYIHCYINIPDTSDRDSLYQAEARQCKNILKLIQENKDSNHLCVFDELYSGTNPEEAITSGYSYLNYLNKFKNVNYILTTHYYKLCKKLENNINKNYHMSTNKTKNNDFDFTYKIKKGISKVKGGIKVLKDLEYPEYIIKNIENCK